MGAEKRAREERRRKRKAWDARAPHPEEVLRYLAQQRPVRRG